MADQGKKYTVLTPNPHFSGRRYGVLFEKGRGKATRHEAEILVKNWGYSCPALEKKSEAKEKAEPQGQTGAEMNNKVSTNPRTQKGPDKKKNK